MASIFSLAERGVLTIEEEPRGMLGSRNFEITRRAGGGPLLPHEERILDAMFRDRSGNAEKVSLMKARNRLTTRWSQVAKAFREELGSGGFLDEGRWALRRRYRVAAVAFMLIAVAGVVPVIPFIERFGPWPLLIPAALLAAGVASLIVGRDDHGAVERGREAGATVAGLSKIPAPGCEWENVGARRVARAIAALRRDPGTRQRLGEVPQTQPQLAPPMVPRAADIHD